MPDFLPRREQHLLTWSIAFDQRLNAAPEDYGISPEAAAEYRSLHDAFAAAFLRAEDPGARTMTAVQAKKDAKAALLIRARQIVKRVRGHGTPGDQLAGLGLRSRKQRVRQIPLPESAPFVRIIPLDPRKPHLKQHSRGTQPLWIGLDSTVTVQVADPASAARTALPRGAGGVHFYTWVGEAAPADASQWHWHGQTSRTAVNLDFPAAPPGSRVWVTAQWFGGNTRGPCGSPASTRIAGSIAAAA